MSRELLEKANFIATILLAATTIIWIIFQMCGKNWKSTVCCIAGIVVIAATGWIGFLMSSWFSTITYFWIAGIVVAIATTGWIRFKMPGRIWDAIWGWISRIVALAATVWVIFMLSEQSLKATCFWIAEIVVLVATVWAMTKMPRRLLKPICYWIAVIMGSTAATVWTIFEITRQNLTTIGYWIVGIGVATVTVGWIIFEMPKWISNIVSRITTAGFPGLLSIRVLNWIFVLGFALVVTFNVVVVEAKSDLIAVVDCVPWKSPDAVARELTTRDVRDWCSMYSIGLRTNSPEGVRNLMLMLPEARYIEVKKDNVRKIHQEQEVVSLPSLANGEQIDIKAWATCKADRPNAKRVRITHLGGRPASLDIRKPCTALAQWVNQHVYIAWGCIGVAICAVLAVVTKRLFGWLHRRKPAEVTPQNS